MLMELLAPGFVMFFFGLSAMSVGLCRFALGEPFSLTWQIAAFSVFSVLYIAFLRRWLKRTFFGKVFDSSSDFTNEYVGRFGKVVEAIEPPLSGRVEIGDAEWSATADSPIPVGATVKVVSQNNLTMKVEVAK